MPAAARRLPLYLFLLAAKTEEKKTRKEKKKKGESREGDRPEQQTDRWILALINHRVKTTACNSLLPVGIAPGAPDVPGSPQPR